MQKNLFIYLNIILILLLSNAICAQGIPAAALEAYDSGKYEKCADLLEAKLNSGSNHLIEFQYLANSYIALKKYDKAIEVLKKAVRFYPANYQILLSLGQLCISDKRYDEAESFLNAIKDKNKEVLQLLSTAYYNHGVDQYQKKNPGKAASFFYKCIETDPQNKDAYTNIISILHEQNKLDEELGLLEKAITLFPGDAAYRRNYAVLLVEKKEYKKAIPLLTEISKQSPSDPDISLLLAKVYTGDHQIGRSDTLFTELLQRFPKNKSIYEEAIAHWTRFNNQKKLRDAYVMMQSNYPEEKNIELKIGRTFEKENEVEEAKKYYIERLSRDRSNVQVSLALAALYRKNDEDSSAIRVLNNILRISKANEPYRMLNEIYIDNEQYREAITLNNYVGRNYYTCWQLGVIYNLMNNKDSSEYFINESYKLKSGDPFILKEKALIEQRRANPLSAIQFAESALKRSILQLDEKQDLIRARAAERSENLIYGQDTDVNQKDLTALEDNIMAVNSILKKEMGSSEYVALLNEYLSIYPRSIFLILFKADKLSESGRYPEAAEEYRKVIQLNPSLKRAHFSLGEVQGKMHLTGEGILSYRRALELDKGDNEIYGRLLALNSEQGTIPDYTDELLRMYKENPDNRVLKERLIEVLHKSGRFEEAKKIITENMREPQ